MTTHMPASEYRRALMASWSEDQLQREVILLAESLGWLVHHDRGDYRQCIGGAAGFPDLVLARAGRVLLIELKSEKGRVTPQQAAWIKASGALLWRPSDWELITRELSRVA